jgi:hypothetical protein
MELVNIFYKGAGVSYQDYNTSDDNLVISNYIFSSYGAVDDTIEYVIYDETGQFLDINYDLKDYKPESDSVNPVTNTYSSLQLDPKKNLSDLGYDRGLLNIQYNFLKNLFNSSYLNNYWIKEISTSRTELKLASQVISNDSIVDGFNNFQTYIANKNYFADFYLNFGLNRLVIANNVALFTEGEETFLLVKLYEPLPVDFNVKTTLWIVDKLAESVSFDVDTQVEAEEVILENKLRGPNFKIKVSDRVGQTTPYYTYDALFSSTVSSSMQKLSSYYDDKAIAINVDYTNFSNFIHFSSAVERLNNFAYKLRLIEDYQSELNESLTFTSMSANTLSSVTQSNILIQNNIDNIIKKFDTYEYYLYYSSESFAWPKSTSTVPYKLYSVTSSEAISWLGSVDSMPTNTSVSMLYSASFYDDTNKDKLSNAIPQYLLDDPNNAPYVTFIDMVAQHFDNIWLYYKDVSNRYDSSNNPNTGVSMDLVADSLRALGIKLYTNTSVSDNLYYTLFGVNPDGSLLPPTGSELINSYVTSSIDTISSNDLEKETYKRIYHNLPYLLKTKGTQRGIKALIACYGIPESILSVNEFGGNNRYTGSGIYEINDEKINVITASAQIQSNLLYPTTTLQKYNTDYRLNTTDIEVGFSPSDAINANFVSSSGFVSLDQLIGNPEYQTLSTYPALEEEKKSYFSTYTYPHSIWEYMRLVKYYNNSLFKMIKDYVPARSNTSTGIIIKSHILERNKYARHEPSMSFDNNLSESIDMLTISAGDAMAIFQSTAWSNNVMTPLGFAAYSSSQDVEKYNGEFSGSFIQVTNGDAISQTELSKNSSGSSQNIQINYGAIYQNVSSSVRSTRFLDLDYSYDQSMPVNLGLITQSISQSQGDNYNTYTNLYNPYAQLQDTNYASRAFTEPRYYGSKTISKLYNTYTGPARSSIEETAFSFTETNPGGLAWFYFAIQPTTYSNPNIIGLSNIQVYLGGYGLINPSDYTYYPDTGTIIFTPGGYFPPIPTYIRVTSNVEVDTSYTGDKSYGKTAAIDKIKNSFAYLKDIYTSSIYFPGRSNAQIKYLIDSNENVLDLTKRNSNIFDIQNVFKSGENCDVALFQYDELNPYSQILANNSTLKIYDGGFRYLPILHNLGGNMTSSSFNFDDPITVETPYVEPGGNYNPNDPIWNVSNWSLPVRFYNSSTPFEYFGAVVYYNATWPTNVTASVTITMPPITPGTAPTLTTNLVITASNSVYSATNTSNAIFTVTANPGRYSTSSMYISILQPTGSGIVASSGSSISYTSQTSTTQTCLYYSTSSNQIVIKLSDYDNQLSTEDIYTNNQPIFDSNSDSTWKTSNLVGLEGNLERVVYPFNLQPGDKISLYNSASLGWSDKFELTVKSIGFAGIPTSASSRLVVDLLETPGLNLFTQSASPDSTTLANFKACKYVIWKRVPDETNIVLKYNPKNSTLVEEGLLYPQYIDQDLRIKSGDIIKSLKSQNLI